MCAQWAATGDTDWNTKYLAYLAVDHNVDGTHKSSIFGFSGYTNEDSDGNAMIVAHAYKAATDGFVVVNIGGIGAGKNLYGYVGGTDDPAGAGILVRRMACVDNDTGGFIFPVAKDAYFEITTNSASTPTIYWVSIGTLGNPVDQD